MLEERKWTGNDRGEDWNARATLAGTWMLRNGADAEAHKWIGDGKALDWNVRVTKVGPWEARMVTEATRTSWLRAKRRWTGTTMVIMGFYHIVSPWWAQMGHKQKMAMETSTRPAGGEQLTRPYPNLAKGANLYPLFSFTCVTWSISYDILPKKWCCL